LNYLRPQQPEAAEFRAELIVDRQFERGTVYDSQVLCRSRIDIDRTITQREAKKFNIALINFTPHIYE